MPSLDDLQRQLAAQGQQIQDAGQNFVKRQIDDPVAMKLQALAQASQRNGQLQLQGASSLPTNAPLPQAPEINTPFSTNPNDMTLHGQAMAAAPEAAAAMKAKFDAQQVADRAADLHSAADSDLSGYTDRPSTVQMQAAAAAQPPATRFSKIHQKLNTGSKITKDDIRDHLHGLTEVTPELEAQLYPEAGDEEKKPKNEVAADD